MSILNSIYLFKSTYEIDEKLQHYEIKVNEETIKAYNKNL